MFEIDVVMKYFYDISKIPRESGKEEKIADYIEHFAKENDFEYIRDKNNNVIIIKEATNSSKDCILLQAHMDMVCEKEKDSNHNFAKDPIEVLKNKYYESINLKFYLENEKEKNVFNKETTRKIIDIINSILDGVYYENEEKAPLVSLNIGKIETKNTKVYR